MERDNTGEQPYGYRPRPFRPAWWLRAAHAQTVAGRLLRYRRDRGGVRLERERVETPDGDFLLLDFVLDAGGVRPGSDGPVVLVLHGLEGSTRRGYALNTYQELVRRGMRPVGMNFRSCGGEPNRLARFYHSGETGDARFVLELLAERFPGAPIGAIGYSLGGNVLLKLLGEAGDAAHSWLRAAVAVSVPFDLAAGADRLERGFGRVYTWHFLRSLKAKYRQKEELLAAGVCDGPLALRARTFREFDDAVTAPLHGFRDADEYYGRCSSAAYISGIRVPTLVLHSYDDPFLPREAVPADAIGRNPHIHAVLTQRGGHLGFISGGTPWRPRFWVESEAARFVALMADRAAAT